MLAENGYFGPYIVTLLQFMLDTSLVSRPWFLGMENHLGPFTRASDFSEGQEQGGGAEGGQGQLQRVKL